MIFWVATVFLLPISPIWPPRRPFLPYGRPNLALAGLLVKRESVQKAASLNVSLFWGLIMISCLVSLLRLIWTVYSPVSFAYTFIHSMTGKRAQSSLNWTVREQIESL